MFKIFSNSAFHIKKLSKFNNNLRLNLKLIKKWLITSIEKPQNAMKNPKYSLAENNLMLKSCSVAKYPLQTFAPTTRSNNFSPSKYITTLHSNSFISATPRLTTVRHSSLCCSDYEKPKMSIVGGPCKEEVPMSCQDFKFEEDPEIIMLRLKTEGAFNCFRVPKPASGKCYKKRTRTIGPWNPKRKYSTAASVQPKLADYGISGQRARAKKEVQKLRNMTEGCCPPAKEPCKIVKKLKSRNPSKLVIFRSCTIPLLLERPIMDKPWEERGCIDLRNQTEGPPCKPKCISTFRMPGCEPRKQMVCDFAPFYYICEKSKCPHPSYSEVAVPPPPKDLHECTYCQRSKTPPLKSEPRIHECPTCQERECIRTWSVDPCVKKRLGILYGSRRYSTQAVRSYSTIQNLLQKYPFFGQSSRAYSDRQPFPPARKINPLIEERCYREKCENLFKPLGGTERCPIAPDCFTKENRAKFCRPPHPDTWGCGVPKASEGRRCVVKKASADDNKSPPPTCKKVKGCSNK